MTVMLCFVLRIGRDGMQSMEFTPGGSLLRFLEDSDLDQVETRRTEIGGLDREPVEIAASPEGTVRMQIYR